MQTSGYTNPKLAHLARARGMAKPPCAPCTPGQCRNSNPGQCPTCDGCVTRALPPPSVPGPPPPRRDVIVVPPDTGKGVVVVVNQEPPPPAAPGPKVIVADLPTGGNRTPPLVIVDQGAPSGEDPGNTGGQPPSQWVSAGPNAQLDISQKAAIKAVNLGTVGTILPSALVYRASGDPAPAWYSGTQADWDALSAADRTSATEAQAAKARLMEQQTSGATNQQTNVNVPTKDGGTQSAQTTVATLNLIGQGLGISGAAVRTAIEQGGATERERIRNAAAVQLARLRAIQNDPNATPAEQQIAMQQAAQMAALQQQLAVQQNTMQTALIVTGAVVGVAAIGFIGYKLLSRPAPPAQAPSGRPRPRQHRR